MTEQELKEIELKKACLIEEQFELEETIRDERFGKIIIMRNRYNPSEKVMKKEIKSRKLYDCEKDIFQVRERMRLNHPNLLKMLDYSVIELQRDEKNSYYIVSGYYEYIKHNLKEELEDRKRKKNKFSGEELLAIAEDLLEVMAFLQKNERIHGDIRPKYISRTDKIILMDRLGDPRAPNQVQLSNIKNEQDLYMSPCLFKVFMHREKKIRHNPYKSDVFSLGVVLLECGLLKSIQDIYNKQNKELDVDRLIFYLNEFLVTYQDFFLLKEVLVWFVDTDGKERKDPKKLLKKFEEIKNKFYSEEEVKNVFQKNKNSQVSAVNQPEFLSNIKIEESVVNLNDNGNSQVIIDKKENIVQFTDNQLSNYIHEELDNYHKKIRFEPENKIEEISEGKSSYYEKGKDTQNENYSKINKNKQFQFNKESNNQPENNRKKDKNKNDDIDENDQLYQNDDIDENDQLYQNDDIDENDQLYQNDDIDENDQLYQNDDIDENDQLYQNDDIDENDQLYQNDDIDENDQLYQNDDIDENNQLYQNDDIDENDQLYQNDDIDDRIENYPKKKYYMEAYDVEDEDGIQAVEKEEEYEYEEELDEDGENHVIEKHIERIHYQEKAPVFENEQLKYHYKNNKKQNKFLKEEDDDNNYNQEEEEDDNNQEEDDENENLNQEEDDNYNQEEDDENENLNQEEDDENENLNQEEDDNNNHYNQEEEEDDDDNENSNEEDGDDELPEGLYFDENGELCLHEDYVQYTDEDGRDFIVKKSDLEGYEENQDSQEDEDDEGREDSQNRDEEANEYNQDEDDEDNSKQVELSASEENDNSHLNQEEISQQEISQQEEELYEEEYEEELVDQEELSEEKTEKQYYPEEEDLDNEEDYNYEVEEENLTEKKNNQEKIDEKHFIHPSAIKKETIEELNIPQINKMPNYNVNFSNEPKKQSNSRRRIELELSVQKEKKNNFYYEVDDTEQLSEMSSNSEQGKILIKNTLFSNNHDIFAKKNETFKEYEKNKKNMIQDINFKELKADKSDELNELPDSLEVFNSMKITPQKPFEISPIVDSTLNTPDDIALNLEINKDLEVFKNDLNQEIELLKNKFSNKPLLKIDQINYKELYEQQQIKKLQNNEQVKNIEGEENLKKFYVEINHKKNEFNQMKNEQQSNDYPVVNIEVNNLGVLKRNVQNENSENNSNLYVFEDSKNKNIITEDFKENNGSRDDNKSEKINEHQNFISSEDKTLLKSEIVPEDTYNITIKPITKNNVQTFPNEEKPKINQVKLDQDISKNVFENSTTFPKLDINSKSIVESYVLNQEENFNDLQNNKSKYNVQKVVFEELVGQKKHLNEESSKSLFDKENGFVQQPTQYLIKTYNQQQIIPDIKNEVSKYEVKQIQREIVESDKNKTNVLFSEIPELRTSVKKEIPSQTTRINDNKNERLNTLQTYVTSRLEKSPLVVKITSHKQIPSENNNLYKTQNSFKNNNDSPIKTRLLQNYTVNPVITKTSEKNAPDRLSSYYTTTNLKDNSFIGNIKDNLNTNNNNLYEPAEVKDNISTFSYRENKDTCPLKLDDKGLTFRIYNKANKEHFFNNSKIKSRISQTMDRRFIQPRFEQKNQRYSNISESNDNEQDKQQDLRKNSTLSIMRKKTDESIVFTNSKTPVIAPRKFNEYNFNTSNYNPNKVENIYKDDVSSNNNISRSSKIVVKSENPFSKELNISNNSFSTNQPNIYYSKREIPDSEQKVITTFRTSYDTNIDRTVQNNDANIYLRKQMEDEKVSTIPVNKNLVQSIAKEDVSNSLKRYGYVLQQNNDSSKKYYSSRVVMNDNNFQKIGNIVNKITKITNSFNNQTDNDNNLNQQKSLNIVSNVNKSNDDKKIVHRFKL